MTWEAGRGRLLYALLMLGCLAGCKGLFGTQGPPEDPLFLNKKPLETKPQNARPAAIAYSEPLPPSNPYADQNLAGPPRKPPPVPGILTNRPAAIEPEEEEPR
jgi:hypothetical protein